MHETPLFMRVLENPVVRNNAASDAPKSMEIFGFSTVFLGFFGFSSEKPCFYRVSATFASEKLRKTALFSST